MSSTKIDYDKYYGKHCARYYGWLPASKEYQKIIKKRPIKYFTLCAKEAIDVFMLEKEGILLRDQNKNLSNVIICEREPRDATEIFRLVRPPLKEAILVGKLEDILTFQDTDETRGLSPDEDVKDRKIRELLKIKGLSERIKEYFPFHIVNFDPYESLVALDFEENKMYQAFEKIFELQKFINSFLLFVTTSITNIHRAIQSRFKSDFASNFSSYSDIRDALSSDGITAYDDISDENKRKVFGFAKSIVMSAARSKGWNCEHKGIYIYEYKPEGTRMLSLVVKLYRVHSEQRKAAYVQDVIQIIKSIPNYYPYKEYDKVPAKDDVKIHLEEVKKYREEIRGEYKE